jgi:hypothetical protein
MAEERKTRKNPTAPLPADQEQRAAGEPTTGGSAPGGAPTGLRQPHGVPSAIGGIEGGVRSGGTPPMQAGGGSGTSVESLAQGPGGTGGMQNVPHGAGRPGETTPPGELDRPPVEPGPEGLRLRDRPGVDPEQRQVQETYSEESLQAG